MRRGALAVLFVLIVAVVSVAVPIGARAAPDNEVTLYFFWGDGCPHCATAKPVLAEFEARYPGLEVRDFEVWGSAENRQLFIDMAAKFDFEPTGVPTFFLGDKYWVGYTEPTTRRQIEAAIAQCVASGCPDAGAGVFEPATAEPAPSGAPPATSQPAPSAGPDDDIVNLPILGDVDAASQSLALTTLLIAGVDGFNPCSLWVLSVLLALTLRTGSRRATVTIGVVFIAVTALVYALFIAGLFTVFSVVSFAAWVRVVVALVAVGFAAINIKDYFWFKQGVSLTIPDAKKPGIYQRLRHILAGGQSLPVLVAGTVVLAAGVSFVELACTAGFPVLWTNILAAREVTPVVFALLLALYMLIYQLDELAIFAGAVVTLRATKLEEKQGRILKLVGGMLMLSLAVVMLVEPSLMNGVRTSLLVFAAAATATLLVLLLHRVVLPRFGIRIGTQDKGPLALTKGR